MTNIRLIIEYDGTNYHGWQSQANACTVQDTVLSAIYNATKEKVKLHGSGRTDSGVHALGQVANFKTNSSIPPERIKYALNYYLPNDIYILDSHKVSDDFHSRYSVKKKEYVYKMYNSKDPSVFLMNRAFWIRKKLNIPDMEYAAKSFEGEYDFMTFCSSGSSVKSTKRRIYKSTLNIKNRQIEYNVQGSGFLYNMVRIIAGTLIEVGLGKIDKHSILDIIHSKDRTKAGRTAPPYGLYLKKVYY